MTEYQLQAMSRTGETGEIIFRNAAPGSSGGGSAVERPRSLLRPVGSKPTVCYCPLGVCQAPKGFSGPCNRVVDVHAILRAADAQKQAPSIVEVLEECLRWHQGDRWRDGNAERRAAWEAHEQLLANALATIVNGGPACAPGHLKGAAIAAATGARA